MKVGLFKYFSQDHRMSLETTKGPELWTILKIFSKCGVFLFMSPEALNIGVFLTQGISLALNSEVIKNIF